MRGTGSAFTRYALGVLVTGAVAFLAVWALPLTPSERVGAFLGVGAAALSGIFGLWMKRRMRHLGLDGVLRAVGVVFALRLLLVGGGLFWVLRHQLGQAGYVVSFFGLYFILQWLEISYVLAEHKRGSQEQ